MSAQSAAGAAERVGDGDGDGTTASDADSPTTDIAHLSELLLAHHTSLRATLANSRFIQQVGDLCHHRCQRLVTPHTTDDNTFQRQIQKQQSQSSPATDPASTVAVQYATQRIRCMVQCVLQYKDTEQYIAQKVAAAADDEQSN